MYACSYFASKANSRSLQPALPRTGVDARFRASPLLSKQAAAWYRASFVRAGFLCVELSLNAGDLGSCKKNILKSDLELVYDRQVLNLWCLQMQLMPQHVVWTQRTSCQVSSLMFGNAPLSSFTRRSASCSEAIVSAAVKTSPATCRAICICACMTTCKAIIVTDTLQVPHRLSIFQLGGLSQRFQKCSIASAACISRRQNAKHIQERAECRRLASTAVVALFGWSGLMKACSISAMEGTLCSSRASWKRLAKVHSSTTPAEESLLPVTNIFRRVDHRYGRLACCLAVVTSLINLCYKAAWHLSS